MSSTNARQIFYVESKKLGVPMANNKRITRRKGFEVFGYKFRLKYKQTSKQSRKVKNICDREKNLISRAFAIHSRNRFSVKSLQEFT